MAMEQVSDLSDSYINLKMAKAEWELLPIIITFLTPVTVAYSALSFPTFGIFFFIARIEFVNNVGQIVTRIIPSDFWTLLLLSIPALIVSIVASGMLYRLSNGMTSSERVLLVMMAVTIIWVIYNSIFFFGALSVGQLVVGPFPVPFGPLAAVLSRERIMKLTREINELQKPPVPMD